MRVRAGASAALLAGALGAAVIWGCRSAAAVILDLPPAAPRAARPAPAPQTAGPAAAPAVQSAPPPIERVHDPDSVLAELPRDSGGYVDWVAAVRAGVVRPRPALPGRPAPVGAGVVFPFDFHFKVEDEMFEPQFPHSAHGEWLACSGCHPAIYRFRGSRTSMDEIDNGESCGLCHRDVAFSNAACFRCHPAVRARRKVTATLRDDIVFTRDSAVAEAAYPPARFAHWVHRIRYQCTACHPGEFAMRLGGTTLTMAAMKSGRQCGACHDGRTAFGLLDCVQCHAASRPAEAGERSGGPGG